MQVLYNKYPKFEWRQVSQEEFYLYIKNYPRELQYNRSEMCEPSLHSYNDFSIANKFPYSMVARFYLKDGEGGGEGFENEYYVRDDIQF